MTARHCHAAGQGPCLASDCPIPIDRRPSPCPGAPGDQHPADGKCWRHDYAHREYVCTCDPPVVGDTGRTA